MDTLLQDIRFAVRTLLKRPGFTVAVVLTLGLGIAANTAIFSVANAVLLDPLPFDEADRMVSPNPISSRGFRISLSIPNYYDWKEQARSWESFGAYRGDSAVFIGSDRPEVVRVRQVLGDFFEVLRVTPAHGRLITAAESEPGAVPIAVISDGFWQRRLGGADDVVGSSITLDNLPYTVIGILPPGAEFPSPDDEVFIPMGLVADDMAWDNRGSSSGTGAIARLAEGVTLQQAQADLDQIIARIQEEEPGAATAELVTVAELYVGDVRTPVLVLMGAVGLVLLIACANVANLLLVRGEGRRHELAVRTALGAGRGRVLRQLLTESLMLGAAGGIVGIGIASLAISAMVGSLPDEVPALVAQSVNMDTSVLAFTFVLSLLAGLLFGFAPALRSARPEVVSMLKEGGRGGTGGERRRLSSGLVIAEISLSLMLLAGAGLLVKSLDQLHRVDKGFDESNVLTLRVPLPGNKYDTEERWRTFYTQLTGRTKALPGVEYASVSQIIPLAGNSWERSVSPEGVDPQDPDNRDSVLYYIADVDHFDVLGIDIVRGRKFDQRDIVGNQPVVIIDETMAEKYWPGEDPIGKRVTMESERPEGAAEDADPVPVYRTVVGVARHVRHYEIEETSRIEAYLPFHQSPRQWGFGGYLMVRTAGDPAAIVGMVRGEVEALDPDQPITRVSTLTEVVDGRLSTYNAMRGLLVIFSALALSLAAVGIYGVMSFSVAERSREIGIRMALGAERGSVLGLVCSQGLKLTALGLAVGLTGALLLTRSLQSNLYGVSTTEPMTLITVSAILATVALAAAYLPARRASRVDPATVLRNE